MWWWEFWRFRQSATVDPERPLVSSRPLLGCDWCPPMETGGRIPGPLCVYECRSWAGCSSRPLSLCCPRVPYWLGVTTVTCHTEMALLKELKSVDGKCFTSIILKLQNHDFKSINFFMYVPSAVEIRRTCQTIGHFLWMSDIKAFLDSIWLK